MTMYMCCFMTRIPEGVESYETWEMCRKRAEIEQIGVAVPGGQRMKINGAWLDGQDFSKIAVPQSTG